MRILVVEDLRDAADSMAILLKLWGYRPAIAYDGEHACELATALRPDVVLLDIGLPGMDGCEVARRLRQLPQTANSLLVAISGYGREADVQRCKEAGIDRHFLKPVEPGELQRLLANTGKVRCERQSIALLTVSSTQSSPLPEPRLNWVSSNSQVGSRFFPGPRRGI
jgi:CheY-like chemotaxis protein